MVPVRHRALLAGLALGRLPLGRFALGHFLALLARLGEADGDCLLLALHRAARAAFAALERTLLAPVQRAFHVLAGAARVFGHDFLLVLRERTACPSVPRLEHLFGRRRGDLLREALAVEQQQRIVGPVTGAAQR